MINKAILLGTLEGKPETRSFSGGGRVANLTLVTTEKWKDGKTQEDRVRPEYHKVAVFVERYIDLVNEVEAGTLLYIEGVMEGRSWTDKKGAVYQGIDVTVRPHKGNIQVMDNGKP